MGKKIESYIYDLYFGDISVSGKMGQFDVPLYIYDLYFGDLLFRGILGQKENESYIYDLYFADIRLSVGPTFNIQFRSRITQPH